MTSQLYDFSLADKVALVTGGASGIGSAIVDAYAAKGATVVVLDKAPEAAEQKVSEGSAAATIGCDVTIQQSVADAVSNVSARFGRIDVLVNSAGIALTAPAEELTVEVWEQTMAVNLRGAFLVSQQVGRIMLAQGSGTVISLASQAATVALPGHLAYCASKFGVVGLTKVLALEWAGRGVTANTISPTVVMTPLAKELWDNPEGDVLKAQIPTHRFAEPEEIAAVAVFLASDAAKMINGADLLVDGGYTIR
ncbi:MAG TPA: D-threitol dehydrogenase [Propionibacteriaceae bacterium]|nr:D-threitol dehydrogenase [Propionibacteriaceae bacterium]